MKRWIIIIVVCLLVLVVVAVAAIQVILLTDLPRQWILQALAAQTGFNVQAESISIDWSGRTIVRKSVVTMPLEDQEFLSADAIELSHTSIPMILLTRSFTLKAVRIDSPHVVLWRNEQGYWNVQAVAEWWTAMTGSAERPEGMVALPDVDIEGGSIEVIDPNGPNQMLGPLTFQAQAEKGAGWRFSLQAAEGIDLRGRLAQGGNWTHRVEFEVEPNAAFLQGLLGRQVADIRTAGRWDGRMEGDGLRGRVQFDTLRAGPVTLAGAVNIATEGAGVILSPDGLVLNEPEVLGEKLRVAGGRIRAGSSGIRAENILIRTETTAARLSGQWDLDTQMGEGSASWTGRMPERQIEHNGSVEIMLRTPPHVLKEVHLTAKVEAKTPVGTWRGAVAMRGSGAEWQTSLWRTSLETFTWTREQQEYDLSGATVEVSVDAPQVRLTRLSLPKVSLIDAGAQWHWDTQQWAMRFDATGFRLPQSDHAGMDIRLRGEGDSEKAVFSDLRIAHGSVVVTGQGDVSVASAEIHNAHISAQWPDRVPASTATLSAQPQNRGQWACEIDIAGKMHPLALVTSGTITGRNVKLGQRQVAQLEIPMEGRVDAERVEIATSPFTLLGGQWQLRGTHELSDPRTALHLTIDDLSLQAAAEMAGSPVKAQGEATAQLQLVVPDFEIEKALAFGSWEVADLDLPPFEAERGQGQVRIADGLVRFDDIELVQGSGTARGAMQFRLDQPQQLTIRFDLTAWPLDWDAPSIVLLADSDIDVQLDVVEKTLRGRGRLSSRLVWNDQEFGRMSASVHVDGRTLEVDDLQGELLGGSVEGAARIPLDQLSESTAELQWRDIQAGQLAPWWSPATRAAGTVSGSMKATQADAQQRPLEPLRIDIDMQMADGRFGTAQVRDGNIVAHLGRDRLLIDTCAFRALGGEIEMWMRVSPHAGRYYLTVTTDFNDLDLTQVSGVLAPDAQPVIGKLSGRGTVLTNSQWQDFSGQVDLSVAESDLVKNPIVRTLYNTLNLSLGQTRPEGTGQVAVLFEGRRIRIPSLVYFNRGVEIRGAVTIDDFSQGPSSPVDGYAVGSTRVLKGVQLPGVRQLDRLMGSLQAGIASVTIGGTIDETTVNVVPLPEIGDAFRRLLWTQLREEE